MHDGNLPSGLASERPAGPRLVHRAEEPFTRAIRGFARWCRRRNRRRSVPEQQAAPSPKLRERSACYGHSGNAPRRWTPSSSPPGSPTSPRGSGWLKHVTVAAFIVFSGDAAAYHDTVWCLGGAKFVDMTDCVVWEDGDKFNYSLRNICNEYLNLTVCWTGHGMHDITYKCDKSHPIPPAIWGRWKPGESGGPVPKGEFVWWAWRCEE